MLPEELEEVGTIVFQFLGDPVELEVHVFQVLVPVVVVEVSLTTVLQVHQFSGTGGETEEMRPVWWEEATVPFPRMWPDDILWFPIMLRWVALYSAVCPMLCAQC